MNLHLKTRVLDKELSLRESFLPSLKNFSSPLAPLLIASEKFSNLKENLSRIDLIPYPKLAFKRKIAGFFSRFGKGIFFHRFTGSEISP